MALCGTIFEKIQNLKNLKNLKTCVFLSVLNFVALCGAMWRYFFENAKNIKNLKKLVFFCFFLVF